MKRSHYSDRRGRPGLSARIEGAGARAILAVAAALVALTGCAVPALPPAMSAARFVRLHSGGTPAEPTTEAPGRGMVNASAGLAFTSDEEENGQFHSFVPEAAISLWPHHRYDLTVAIDSYHATVEGNLVLLDSAPIRLGILHGVSGGMLSELNDPEGDGLDPTFVGGLSAGLFFQLDTGAHDGVFAAARYAYSTSDESDFVLPTHYVTGSVGWMHEIGALRVTPELSIAHGTSVDDDPTTGAYDFWIVVPGLTISAVY